MAGKGGRPNPDARPGLRIDKWLWQARFCKSRAIAAELVEGRRVRVNGQPVSKPGHTVAEGDTLTFAHRAQIRVVRVRALGLRRGPASEAQSLYDDLDTSALESSGPGS